MLTTVLRMLLGVNVRFATLPPFFAPLASRPIRRRRARSRIRYYCPTPGPLFSSANAKIKTFVFTPEAGYKVYNDPEKGSFVQVLGGARIWHISSDLTLNAGVLPAVEINNSRNWVDGVVGLRGKAALTEKVFFIGRFDLGGGGSKFTYQLFGGLGYNVNQKVALVFGYRDLDVNYDKNNFRYDTSQRGPIVGMGFKF